MKAIFISFALILLTTIAHSQSTAIRIEKRGKGSPVLFLPGFTTPGSVWNETIKNLNMSRQSIQVSYAGFNGITPIDTPWYPAIKAALLDYINKEKLTNLTIIGHSIGGSLAIEIAAALPLNVNKLILVDAIPCMRELMMPGVPASQIQYNNPYSNQQLKMGDEAFRQVAQMMAGNMTNVAAKVDTLAQWMIDADRKTYVYGYTDLLKLDLRPLLEQVKAETLILGASFPNAGQAKETFDKQYVKLNNKTIELAPDSKHFVMLDQPLWFYERVNAFMSK
ncbi:MAG TPA: alpha/beta hydrolase [Chitinophagaceae bacterium]|nr:alpha/beta hydrolase [Chitinophagaceae bacterium]